MSISDIISKVSSSYLFVQCNSELLINKCLSIRHKVYCSEKNWEQETANKIEEDFFDASSIHYLVIDKVSGTDVGTFRIIKGCLPLSDFMVSKHILHPDNFPVNSVCELSRLSMLESHRGGALSTVLMLFAGYETARSGKVGCYAVMENRLANMLIKIGISVHKITNDFQKNGKRAVYFSSSADILKPLGFDALMLEDFFSPLTKMNEIAIASH